MDASGHRRFSWPTPIWLLGRSTWTGSPTIAATAMAGACARCSGSVGKGFWPGRRFPPFNYVGRRGAAGPSGALFLRERDHGPRPFPYLKRSLGRRGLPRRRHKLRGVGQPRFESATDGVHTNDQHKPGRPNSPLLVGPAFRASLQRGPALSTHRRVSGTASPPFLTVRRPANENRPTSLDVCCVD